MMRSVKVGAISTKGGSGKSHVTFQAAIEAGRSGLKTLVLDCDERQNSIQVLDQALRDTQMPVVRVAGYETIVARLAEAEREGFDFIFVDSPPGDSQLVNRIASLVDHILVPVRGTTFDLHALINTIDLLSTTVDLSQPAELRAGSCLPKAAVVLNGIPARASEAHMRDIRGALKECGAADLEIIGVLRERAAYVTALAKGLGVTEHGRDREAVKEVEQLFRKLRMRARDKVASIDRLPKARKSGVKK